MLAVGDPVAGIVVAAVALGVALADLSALTPIRRLTPARATQNVVSAPADVPPGSITLIVTAAADRARSGWAAGSPAVCCAGRWPRSALVLACCIARAAGLEETWVGAVQLPPTVVLLACLLAFLDEAVADLIEDDRGASRRRSR